MAADISGTAVDNLATITPLRRYRNSEEEMKWINALRNLFIISRDYKRVRYDSWLRNYRIVMNRLSGATYTSWMPQPRDSEVYPVLSSLVAWMTDQEPEISFTPSADPNSKFYDYVNQISNDLSNVFQTNWLVEGYDKQTKLMLWDAFLYGLGVIKNLWDNDAGGGDGNAVMRRVDPWAFYTDPMATSFSDCEFMIEARRMSYDQLERMYPDTVKFLGRGSSSTDDLDERPSLYLGDSPSVPMAPFLGSLPSGNGVWNRVTSGRKYDPLPGYVVYEFWHKENEKRDKEEKAKTAPGDNAFARPRWRCTVMCNSVILFDEWADDLWQHGQHPYEDFRFDDVGEMYGISLVDHLAFPQIYINRLLTALQQNAELVGNPIFLEPTNSGLARVGIINRPGQRLPISSSVGAAGNNLPRWLEPPSMPASVMELVNFWIGRIENTAGMHALTKGKAPNQRNAEGVIQSVQEAAMVRIRSALANLQWTYRNSAVKLTDLIVQNYTEPRVMAILGADGQQTSMALAGRHFYDPATKGDTPLKFVIRVEAGTNKPTSRQARMAEGEKLLALGAVDDQYVLELHGVKDAQKILQRLYTKRKLGLMAGGPSQRQRAGRTS